MRDFVVLTALGLFSLALTLPLTWLLNAQPTGDSAREPTYCSEFWSVREGETQPHLECASSPQSWASRPTQVPTSNP